MATAARSSALRASWRGELRFDLVSFRVQAYNVLSPGEAEIHFHQLHDECGARIQYQKVCPVHGVLANEQIVLGYQYGRNQYVELDPQELDQMRVQGDKQLAIDRFIEREEIDPLYFDGRAYYLAPQGAEDEEPYAVLCAAMEEVNRWAIGTALFAEREQLVLVRPVDGVLAMMMLRHEPQVRDPAELGVRGPRESAQEVQLAEQLIAAETDREFDFSSYEDRYQKRLAELIRAKIEGRQAARPEEPQPQTPVVNLADALQRSIQKAQARSAEEHSPQPGARRPLKPRPRRAS